MNRKISLIVADDHPLLLKGLVEELIEYGYHVLESVVDGIKAFNSIVEHAPDIAILDVEMPFLTGFEVIQKCREQECETKFIILTSHKEEGYIVKAQKLNISGYILKDEDSKELHKCIKSVYEGMPYFSAEFQNILDNEISPQLQKIRLLSPSERTIVRLVGQGNSSKQISDILSVSPRTVEKHRSNIIAKLELAPAVDALQVWASKHLELLSKL